MDGLIALGLLLLWAVLVEKLAVKVASKFKDKITRRVVGVLVFVLVLPLPVADELYARHQIDALCREGGVLKMDEQKIKGRSVKVSFEPSNADVPGIAIPVRYSKTVLRDVETDEVLGSDTSFITGPGILIRTIGTAEMRSPMFGSEGCWPKEGMHSAAKRIGFKILN